ncbi:hypothetical protein R3P38DRAFT_3175556 [Favolaschia claudopus]|uniref:Uncharacterized protein n=1 Tax=Favolaschia claudopus TaxID=2862362 RepID=A0AAW0D5X6_9AGAR
MDDEGIYDSDTDANVDTLVPEPRIAMFVPAPLQQSQPAVESGWPPGRRQTLRASSPERQKIAGLNNDVRYHKEMAASARREVRHLKAVARDQNEQIARVDETLVSQGQIVTQMTLEYQGMKNTNEQLIHMLQELTSELNLRVQHGQALPVPRLDSVTLTRARILPAVPFSLAFTFFVLHAGMQGGWAHLVIPYLLCIAAFYL